MKCRASAVFFVVFIAQLAWSQTALAAECYRSDECAGAAICVDLTCVEADQPLEACLGSEGCEDWGAVCHDGYCKPKGVSCSNPAGECTIGDGWGECSCGDGIGFGFSDAEPDPSDPNNEPPPTDQELYEECVDHVVSGCGEEAPDISDYCNDQELAACTSLLEKMQELDENCDLGGGDPDEGGGTSGGSTGEETTGSDGSSDPLLPPPPEEGPSFFELRECCEELDEPEMTGFAECLGAIEADDCEGAENCSDEFGFGEPGSAGSGGDDTYGEDEHDEAKDDNSDDGQDGDNATGEGEGAEEAAGSASDEGDSMASNAAGTGCSFVPQSSLSARSVFSLLASFF